MNKSVMTVIVALSAQYNFSAEEAVSFLNTVNKKSRSKVKTAEPNKEVEDLFNQLLATADRNGNRCDVEVVVTNEVADVSNEIPNEVANEVANEDVKPLKKVKLDPDLAKQKQIEKDQAKQKALEEKELAKQQALEAKELAKQELAKQKEVKTIKVPKAVSDKKEKATKEVADEEPKEVIVAAIVAVEEPKKVVKEKVVKEKVVKEPKEKVVKEPKEKASKEKNVIKNDKKDSKEEADEAPVKVTVTRIKIGDQEYLKSAANILYNPETKEEVGLYDVDSNSIKALPDDDEEELEEDTYESECE